MITPDDVFQIGRLGRPHGVKGEITFQISDDVFDRVDAEYLLLELDGILVPFFMEEYRFKSDETVLMKFCDIDTQEQARSLTGAKVYFPRELSDSDEAGFGWSEIVGFKLIDSTTGREVGTIDHVDDSTINTLFDINTPAGDSLLVPAHEELIEKVDAEARAIWTLLPEALHQITVVMSDRGIPASYRHMHGFGSHTYSLINAENKRFWVKFHFKTQQGIKNLTDAEAQELIGRDRDSHQRDLYEHIEKGDFPRWTLYFQIMPEEDAEKLPYHPFDLTKVWYHKDYPLIEVGVLELNRNPENYFAEVEQAAFNPANLVPGIGVSPDKMLQGRLFSYGDAQRYRLGVNHNMIPVNRPRCPYHSFHRDGAMRVDGNYGSYTSYEPNSTGAWQEQPDFSEPPLKISGDADRWDYPCDDADYFEQPGKLFRVMTPEQQEELFGNTARALGDAPREIKLRHIRHCAKADPAYGAGVARACGIPESEI